MGTVTVPNVQAAMPKNYMHSHLIHPATMDSMLHLFLAAIMDSNGGVMLKEPMLPVFIQEVWASAEINSKTGHSFHCHGKAAQISHNKYQANITVWDGLQGEARITINGLQSIPLQSTAVAASSERKLAYYVDWKPEIDLLDSNEYFLKTADLKDNSAYLEQVKNLQLASMLLIKNALKDFHGKPTQPHLEKYLEWMHHHSDNLANGKVIHQVPEWEPYFDNKELGDSFIEKVGSSTADGQLTVHMGKEIAPILRGDVDALHLLFNGEFVGPILHPQLLLRKYRLSVDLLPRDFRPQLRRSENTRNRCRDGRSHLAHLGDAEPSRPASKDFRIHLHGYLCRVL
jgi:hypothetical protein